MLMMPYMPLCRAMRDAADAMMLPMRRRGALMMPLCEATSD